MATRFAGDFFGIPLVIQDDSNSNLLDYFPSLGHIGREESEPESNVPSSGVTKAAKPFTGFKTFESSSTQTKAAPLFTGFKTLESKRSPAQ